MGLVSQSLSIQEAEAFASFVIECLSDFTKTLSYFVALSIRPCTQKLLRACKELYRASFECEILWMVVKDNK